MAVVFSAKGTYANTRDQRTSGGQEWGSSLPLTIVAFRDYEQRSTADLIRTQFFD
jgi:hypothetical protein